MTNDDANESYELFQSTLLSLFNDHFPQTKNIYNKADRKQWITPGILTSIRAKRHLEKRREVTQTHISPSIGGIKTSPKLLALPVTNIIVPCYSSIGNTKKIWFNINCILGKKHSSINTTIKLNGIHVAEPETIANVFNSYFNSIPIMLSDNINNNLTAFESWCKLRIKFRSRTIFIKHPFTR